METALRPKALTIRVGCTFNYSTMNDVPAICLVRPAGTSNAEILSETWSTTPATPYHDYTDLYGNVCRRLTLASGEASLTYDAHVQVADELDAVDWSAPEVPINELPDDVLLYTLPSRFCLSDALYDRAWSLFGQTKPGWERVQAIVSYVHNNVQFGYQYTTPSTTSSDVLANMQGVCRDFAHLSVALCRAMSIPTRYCFGYLPDLDVPITDAPMDFCAWTEVYLGGRWWTFDPRNNILRRGRVIIGRGRDAADVAMVTTYGNALFKDMTVWADKVEI